LFGSRSYRYTLWFTRKIRALIREPLNGLGHPKKWIEQVKASGLNIAGRAETVSLHNLPTHL
jgi:hypothetical protein